MTLRDLVERYPYVAMVSTQVPACYASDVCSDADDARMAAVGKHRTRNSLAWLPDPLATSRRRQTTTIKPSVATWTCSE